MQSSTSDRSKTTRLLFFLVRKSRQPGGESRRGAIIVLFALLLIVVMAMAAFLIDIGYINVIRTELQLSVDSGALAGAAVLADGSEAARTTVREYVQRNPVGNQPVAEEDIEIEIGCWDEESRSFRVDDSLPSAIRVVAHQLNRPMFFGKALGHDSFSVQAEAVAIHQPRDIMIVLDYSSSMKYDSELRHIGRLGQAPIEANLRQIYEQLGSPRFGDMVWNPVFISSNNTNTIKNSLGLRNVTYPYPSGSWDDFINYVRNDSYIRDAGYQKKYGYLTLVNYWLALQYRADQTPDLWNTSEQPITAIKDAVTMFLDFIGQSTSDDRIGLAVYTHPNGGSKLEAGLTYDLAQIDDISRHRQAGHYTSGTNIGAGLQRGRIELEQNARPASLKMVILMTDGQANEPEGRASEFLLEEAQLCANNGYPVFTISLGTDADPVVMQRIADMTGGVHFNIPGGGGVAEYQEQLQQVFRKIAEKRPLRLVR